MIRLTLSNALTIACVSGVLNGQTLQAEKLFAISGIVRDLSGAPLPGVEIMILINTNSTQPGSTTRTSADGSFAFARLPGVSHYIRARRPGYRMLVARLRPDTLTQRRPFIVTLAAIPVELESVEVEERSTAAMKDFDERKQKRGTGRFIDRAEIARRRPAYASDLLQYFPGMAVRPGKFGNTVRVRGCKPSVWIDGVQAQGAELDEVTNPSEIEGLEVYSSFSGVPPEYGGRGARSCGAILVWTRIR